MRDIPAAQVLEAVQQALAGIRPQVNEDALRPPGAPGTTS
jgi:hypothetical protein